MGRINRSQLIGNSDRLVVASWTAVSRRILRAPELSGKGIHYLCLPQESLLSCVLPLLVYIFFLHETD